LIGGAVGPLANASLLRKDLSKNELVTTSAVLMAITHVLKIIAFIVLGVSVAQWWKLILGMSVMSVLGSWVGTGFRRKVDDHNFKRAFSVLLTVLALRMVYITIY